MKFIVALACTYKVYQPGSQISFVSYFQRIFSYLWSFISTFNCLLMYFPLFCLVILKFVLPCWLYAGDLDFVGYQGDILLQKDIASLN